MGCGVVVYHDLFCPFTAFFFDCFTFEDTISPVHHNKAAAMDGTLRDAGGQAYSPPVFDLSACCLTPPFENSTALTFL